MKFQVRTKPNAKEEKVISEDSTHLKVFVKASPQEGKANEAVIALLARHFKIPKSSIAIVSGLRSKNKVIEIQ